MNQEKILEEFKKVQKIQYRSGTETALISKKRLLNWLDSYLESVITTKINRVWAMPNRWTFTIKPIKKLLEKYRVGKNGKWADPFCGENSPANVTNDINPAIRATQHSDALKFLKNLEDNYFTGILYDPPYSITQARMYGKKEFASMKYWAGCKNEMARAIEPGGYAICFGWNSNGLGKGRGFEMTQILLVSHGGSKNDTICTVERKIDQIRHNAGLEKRR